MEEVILIDDKDNVIGQCEKSEAHQKNLKHRAFSVFVFNDKKELLLQKRAAEKYHSAGLWTNTCCGHPRPGESTQNAAERRLMEEMGFKCDLKYVFEFSYQVDFENGLHENELDHVYSGTFNGKPVLNPAEADDWKFAALDFLKKDIAENPLLYTEWFKIAMKRIS